jgi:hypothetical protein
MQLQQTICSPPTAVVPELCNPSIEQSPRTSSFASNLELRKLKEHFRDITNELAHR